jgi:hypothetical protein
MKQFVISYVSRNGVTMLNIVVEASSRSNAIDEIKEDAYIVLSCVTIKS